MGIGYVEEIAAIDTGGGDFQHSAVPEYAAAHFGVEIVPEPQDRGTGWNHDPDEVIDAATNPIVVGRESAIRRRVRVNIRDIPAGIRCPCGQLIEVFAEEDRACAWRTGRRWRWSRCCGRRGGRGRCRQN